MTKISVSLPAELIERIDARAAEMQRSRSNAIAVLLEQSLIPGTVTTSSNVTLHPPVPTVVLDPGYMEAPDKPVCAEGQHVRAAAKSGSGMIGCKNCGMVKIGPNWVNPK